MASTDVQLSPLEATRRLPCLLSTWQRPTSTDIRTSKKHPMPVHRNITRSLIQHVGSTVRITSPLVKYVHRMKHSAANNIPVKFSSYRVDGLPQFSKFSLPKCTIQELWSWIMENKHLDQFWRRIISVWWHILTGFHSALITSISVPFVSVTIGTAPREACSKESSSEACSAEGCSCTHTVCVIVEKSWHT